MQMWSHPMNRCRSCKRIIFNILKRILIMCCCTPRKLHIFDLQHGGWKEDEFPFNFGVNFRFQPIVFGAVYVCIYTHDLRLYFNFLLVVSNIFYFHPYLGKISNLTSIFFRWVVQPPTRFAFEHLMFFLVIT